MKAKWILIPIAAMALLAACNGQPNNPSGGNDSSAQTTYDPATSVEIDASSIPEKVYVRDAFKLSATVLPATANPAVTWSSSNSSVASIDEQGNFIALAVGLTTIKATTDNGLYAKQQIVVKEYVPVETFSVANANATVPADGGFYFMDPVITPEGATNKKVNYTSSNPNVASVDENGVVTGKSAGNAVITATSDADKTKTATTNITVETQSWANKEVVDVTEGGKVDFQDVQRAGGLDAIPVGKSKNIELLVVPYEFADYPFDAKTLGDIDALFNGKGAEDTRYWESVSSYYNKASYGKINIHVTIGEKYSTTDKAQNTSGNSYSVNAARTVLADYKARHSTDGKEFDSDSNGIVDALYMIYSAPDYSKVSSLNQDLFWAYCHWTGASPNLSSPSVNTYMWASYDFMYESGSSKVDAHTFIHETGHLMGANDYYNYNRSSYRRPLGGIDMMDENIGSHNVWTKMAYGWLDPIYVNGNAKVKLRSAQEYGDAILLKDGWNGSSFDEMIMIELSTPTGLNELDSRIPYKSRPLVYNIPGIKMYHIDNRLGRAGTGGTVQYFSGTPTRSNIGSYTQVTANTDNRDRNDTPELYYEIGLIQRGKKATLIDSKVDAKALNEDLFQTGDYFRFDEYQDFFQREKTLGDGSKVKVFNDGSSFNYQIYFENVTATEATVVIQKVAA